jgi:hypothetical protein
MNRRHCVYCGVPLGRPGRLACYAHRDLPALDPYYCRAVTEPTTEHWVPSRLDEHIEQVVDRLVALRRAA